MKVILISILAMFTSCSMMPFLAEDINEAVEYEVRLEKEFKLPM